MGVAAASGRWETSSPSLVAATWEAQIHRLRILVADDHRLMRDAIRSALENEQEIEIVGEAQSGEEVLRLVARTRPDLVLLDLRMPGMSGFTVLERLRADEPNVKVVILSGVDEPRVIESALRRGADAFVLKQVDPRDLAATIRQVTERTVFRLVAAQDGANRSELNLSPKELTILRGVASGASNKELARTLWLTEQTVKFHLTNVYRKLGVANRTEAAHYAHEHGLVGDGEVDAGLT
jgi:DNA-binding NarL/FixJ family response regulator